MQIVKNYFGHQFVDRWNLPVTKAPKFDGGDTLQRYCMMIIIYWILNGFNIAPDVRNHFRNTLFLYFYDHDQLMWRRHPDQTMWYFDLDRLSGDQAVCLIMALGIIGEISSVRVFHKKHKDNHWFLFNYRKNWVFKDPVQHCRAQSLHRIGQGVKWTPKTKTPDFRCVEFQSLYNRILGWNSKWKYVTDISTFAGSLFKFVFRKDHDILNHVAVVLFCRYYWPTFWSKWSFKLLLKSDYRKRLESYFSGNDSPLFGEKIIMAIEKMEEHYANSTMHKKRKARI